MSGFSFEHILKVLKWWFGEEDCNYPMPRYQGRKMIMYRIRELLDGIELDQVIEIPTADTFAACPHEDENPSLLQRALCVIHRFLQLEEVGIHREWGGCDDDISFTFDGHNENFISLPHHGVE